jgi:sodium transport system permease protein
MTVNLGWQFCRVVLPIMLPLVILLSILQTLVAAYSKNFREAQTALGLLQLLPMIPSIALVIAPIKVVTWMYAVPLLGQQLTIMRMLRGEAVTPQQQLLCVVCTLAAAGLVWLVAKRVYGSERLAVSA